MMSEIFGAQSEVLLELSKLSSERSSEASAVCNYKAVTVRYSSEIARDRAVAMVTLIFSGKQELVSVCLAQNL